MFALFCLAEFKIALAYLWVRMKDKCKRIARSQNSMQRKAEELPVVLFLLDPLLAMSNHFLNRYNFKIPKWKKKCGPQS